VSEMNLTVVCHSRGGKNVQSQSHSTISKDFGAGDVPAALLFDWRICSIAIGEAGVNADG